MPLDRKGIYRHNDQVARLHGGGKSRDEMKDDILSGRKPETPTKEEGLEGEHMEVHPHGDGTFHTLHHKGDGEAPERVDHETIGHMHAHLSRHFGADGEKHFHAHHDGFEPHSHSVTTGEEPEHQEHDPDNIEAIKDHLGQFFSEEEQEGKKGEYNSEENTAGTLGSRALGM